MTHALDGVRVTLSHDELPLRAARRARGAVYAILFITIVERNHETEPWFAVLLVGSITSVPVIVAL